MRFPNVSSFFSFSKKLTSSTPSKDSQAAPVGVGTSQVGGDEYFHQEKFNQWIEETKHKIPIATPALRREAFQADPLLKGTIYPYLKNVLLQDFTIQTKDNKLYSEAITEITAYLEQIELMQVFRDDFLDFAILTGHSYRRMDPDKDLNVAWLEKIEPSSVTTYTDPWESSVVAYHQKARVMSSWSSMGTTSEVNSWFIPFGNTIKTIYDTYIQDRPDGNNEEVNNLFEKYKQKYLITDVSNLRIGSSERIIAMHNSERLATLNDYDDCYEGVCNPAPIDSVLLAIWLKRLLLSNAPHLIYIVINPFLHARSGIIKETKDALGNTSLISSVPQKPSTQLQTSNPDIYNNMLQNFNNWINGIKEAQKKIMKCVKNGGVFTSGPDLEIKPIESARNVTHQFIKSIIDMLNEEIGQAFGFPMALIQATGTELASSRNILQMFNNVHAGERTEYESVADRLIKKQFAERTWQGTTVENGKEVTVTYSFEDIQAHFVLDTPDVKDLLNEAQALKARAETLTQLKGIGAGKEDLQALGEEAGFGLLGLDGFEALSGPEDALPGNQTNAILQAIISEALREQGLVSSSPTDPSNFKDKKITERLQNAYQTAKETIDQLFEEH